MAKNKSKDHIVTDLIEELLQAVNPTEENDNGLIVITKVGDYMHEQAAGKGEIMKGLITNYIIANPDLAPAFMTGIVSAMKELERKASVMDNPNVN